VHEAVAVDGQDMKRSVEVELVLFPFQVGQKRNGGEVFRRLRREEERVTMRYLGQRGGKVEVGEMQGPG